MLSSFQAVQHQNRLRRLLEFGSYGELVAASRTGGREHVAIIEAIAAGDLNRPPGECAYTSNTHCGHDTSRAKKMATDDVCVRPLATL